jgi:hypothetical protein
MAGRAPCALYGLYDDLRVATVARTKLLVQVLLPGLAGDVARAGNAHDSPAE